MKNPAISRSEKKIQPPKAVASFIEVERAERKFYLDYLREGMIVFDVGANIGELTLMFSRFVGAEGRVHAFEPSGVAFERLVALCSAASLRNVELQSIALSDNEQSVVLYSYGDDYLSWTSQALRPLENYGINVTAVSNEAVPATTLDLYGESRGIMTIDLLKIDVEGAELQVLLGAKRLLEAQAIRCITFEFGQTTFDMNNEPGQIAAYLNSLGYDFRNLVKGDPIFPGGENVGTACFAMHVATPAKKGQSIRATPLHPLPEAEDECPHCRNQLKVTGWYMPGMRTLATIKCVVCDREYYKDLAAGQGLYTPMLLEKKTGVVHDPHNVAWFADWLRDSYAHRRNAEVSFNVKKFLPLRRQVVLLNCLDTLYGHSLLKLLNAQYYLDRNLDLIVIVPAFLEWMVPEGAAEVWIIGMPLKDGYVWNDWIAEQIASRVKAIGPLSLSKALSYPKPHDFAIERFTRVNPFPLAEWEARLHRPVVTFIWRDDRLWSGPDPVAGPVRKRPWRQRQMRDSSLELQSGLVIEFGNTLRSEWPNLDFAVAGFSAFGSGNTFPSWIQDLRRSEMDHEAEVRACQRYAASHIVVGVHGSNMLLPTGHSGGAVELLDTDRWGNFTQDILFRETGDSRDTLFRYRFLPTAVAPAEVASLVSLQLRGYPAFKQLMNIGSAGY